MAPKQLSFEEIYRANQARAERDAAPTSGPGATGGTLTLDEPAGPDPDLFALGSQLTDSDVRFPEKGASRSLFGSGAGDLGGLPDPNQEKDANPYDSAAGGTPRVAKKKR